jgi:hypothetical protein
MQTLLTVAIILAAIYLIIVIIEVIVVLALRREYQPMQHSIMRAQQDVRDARKRIDQFAPFIESGAKEPPFDALYAQARDLLRRANESVREAQRQLDAATRDAIPEQPLARSFLIAPIAKEISQRAGLRRGAKTAAVQLTTFNETFERIGQIQADIKALPKKEQESLNGVRQRSVDASAAIDAEARPKLLLAAERDKLRQVDGFIAQMGSLLADSAPTEAAVVAAHGLRLRAEEQLQALETALQRVAGERTSLLDMFAAAGNDLAQFQEKIAEEASAGMTRKHFTESIAHLQARHAEIKTLAFAGDYGSARGALDEWRVQFADARSRHAQVQQARDHIALIDAKAQQRIATLKQWMSETPARFDLDLTRGMVQQLENVSAQLTSLLPSEDIDALHSAGALDAHIDDLFNRATAMRHDFEQGRNQFDEMAATVNDASVPAMAAQAQQVAGELAKVNAAYWGNLTPARMEQASAALVAQWDAERDHFLTIKESELPATLARLQHIRERYNVAGALHADALKVLTTVDADKLQAQTGLQDDVIGRALAEADAIGRGSPSLAQTPAVLMTRAAELREALQAPAPHYKALAANAQQLRSDAQAFIAGHNKQQQATRASLAATHERMVGLRARLAAQNDDARIDFAGWTAPAMQRMDAWMSRRDALQTVLLDAMQSALQEGDAIIVDAEGVLANAAQVSRRLSERGDALRTALAELNGVMSAAQAGLRAMSDMGSARWGEAMLDDARKPMIATVERMALLEQPQQRLSPEIALATMDEAERDVQAARAHADAHLAEISSRLGAVDHRRHALAQALAVAQDAATGDAQLQQELREVQARVQQLQSRSADATSYAEALDALTQALQHVQRFTARVVGI